MDVFSLALAVPRQPHPRFFAICYKFLVYSCTAPLSHSFGLPFCRLSQAIDCVCFVRASVIEIQE